MKRNLNIAFRKARNSANTSGIFVCDFDLFLDRITFFRISRIIVCKSGICSMKEILIFYEEKEIEENCSLFTKGKTGFLDLKFFTYQLRFIENMK